MTTTWIRPVQLTLGAVALCMASWASAQTAAPADSAAPAAATAEKAPGKAKHHMGKHQHRHHKGEHAKHSKDPATREAAAVREQERHGGMGSKDSMDQYQRNAMARCEVFKTPEDRHACAERVRQSGDGSVQGGGILREYTQEVRVPQ